MQPTKKSNSVVTSTWDLVTGIITFTVVGIAQALSFNARKIVGEKAYDALTDNGKRAVLHGFTQRISDRAAIQRDKVTGVSASPAEKHNAMKVYVDHLTNGGGWELAGGGLPPLNRPALYQAVAAVRGFKAEDVEKVYRDKPDEVVRTLLSISAIAGKYTELSRQGITPNEKADELMKELEKAAAKK